MESALRNIWRATLSKHPTLNTPETIETFLRRMHRAGLVVAGVYFTPELVTSFGHLDAEQTIALFRSLVADFDAKQQASK